jgi:hypothetical protein
MSGDPQLIKYFAQCPELSFYSVAQLFKCSGFDVVLFVCVSCRGVIKGKVRACERVRGGARCGEVVQWLGSWWSGGGYSARLKAKKFGKKKPNKLIGFKKKLFFFLGDACV